MPEQRLVLEHFVQTILNKQGDRLSKQGYEEYGNRCKEMVRTLEITEKTISNGIGIMADEIFLYQVKYYNVLMLLIFCIQLDKHCKLNEFEWYTQELLVKILVDILCDVNFIPPPPLISSSSSCNTCIIIYFIVLFFLPYKSGIPNRGNNEKMLCSPVISQLMHPTGVLFLNNKQK